MVTRLIVAVVALIPSLAAMGDTPPDLATLFPKDTILYASCAGADAHDRMAKDTSWGRMLAEPEVQRLMNSVYSAVDGLARSQAAHDEMPIELYENGLKIATNLWRSPTAIGLIDANLRPGYADVHAAIVCRAGKDAADVAKSVTYILKSTGAPIRPAKFAGHDLTELAMPPDFNRVYFGAVKDYFVVLCGDRSAEVLQRIDAGGENLAQNENLVASRKRIQGGDDTRSMWFFVDCGRIMAKAKDMLNMAPGADREEVEKVFHLIDGLGFGNLASITWESHYLHGGCYNAVYFRTPGGGKGLFASSARRLTDDDLKLIPKHATWACAGNMHVADAVRSILEQAKTLGPDVANSVSGVETMTTGVIGMPLVDFLDLFDDTFILYDAPQNGGFWVTGTVMIAECKDAAKVQQHVGQCVRNFAGMLGSEGKVNIKSFDHKGHTVQFVNVVGLPMPVAPAWSDHDGWLVMALYPQMVMATLDRLDAGELKRTSILSNKDFIDSRKALGRLGRSVTYVDTRDGIRTLYPFALALAQAGAAMAQGEGVAIDVSAIPSLPTIEKHVHAQVQFTENDNDGTLCASFGSFPIGVNSVAPASILMAAPALAIGIPQVSKSEVESNQTMCAVNLRGIGQGIYIYANDHDGKFPPNFQALIDANNNTRKQFICPATHHSEADGLDASYVYVPGQTTYSDPRNVLVYERPENHEGKGVNVLFQDAHVQFLKMGDLKKQLAETEARLKKVNG